MGCRDGGTQRRPLRQGCSTRGARHGPDGWCPCSPRPRRILEGRQPCWCCCPGHPSSFRRREGAVHCSEEDAGLLLCVIKQGAAAAFVVVTVDRMLGTSIAVVALLALSLSFWVS